jgi:hypothetical protein
MLPDHLLNKMLEIYIAANFIVRMMVRKLTKITTNQMYQPVCFCLLRLLLLHSLHPRVGVAKLAI